MFSINAASGLTLTRETTKLGGGPGPGPTLGGRWSLSMRSHESYNDDTSDRQMNADQVNEEHTCRHVNDHVKRERGAEAKGCGNIKSDLFQGLSGHHVGIERKLVSLQPDNRLNHIEGPVLRFDVETS
jgi:hypothetical protein